METTNGFAIPPFPRGGRTTPEGRRGDEQPPARVDPGDDGPTSPDARVESAAPADPGRDGRNRRDQTDGAASGAGEAGEGTGSVAGEFEWPGFRTTKVRRWGADLVSTATPRHAVGDANYPQKVANAAKNGRARDSKELEQAIDRQLTAPQIANRKALARGLVTPTDMQPLAQVIRFLPGGRNTFLGYIQRAARNGDPDAMKFWSVYIDLRPITQKRIDLDAVCEGAGVAPDAIVAVAVSTAMRLGADTADLVAAAAQPMVVRQTVKSAMRIGGDHAKIAQKDREFVLQHHRWIPTRGTVNISATANASSQAAAAAAAHPSVPSFAESLNNSVRAREAVQREHGATEPIDGEVED